MSPITSDSIPVTDPEPGSPPRSRLSGTPEWLLRVTVESVLIVLSILLALAVDAWRESRNERQLARQSLQIFESELRQNLARLDDALPYHTGVMEVASGMTAEPDRGVEIQSLMEGLRPVDLYSTAWETALATGALTRIDFETVRALSLTYNLQQRYREEMRAGLPRLVTDATMSEAQQLAQMQQAVRYLTDMVSFENDLHVFCVQALEFIARAIGTTAPVDTAGHDSIHR